MSDLFASGAAAGLVLLVMLGEAALLIRSRRRPGEVLLALLPGALLAAALGAALAGADWRWIALPLALSFPVHLADLGRRGWLRRSAPPQSLQAVQPLPSTKTLRLVEPGQTWRDA